MNYNLDLVNNILLIRMMVIEVMVVMMINSDYNDYEDVNGDDD